MLKLLIGLKPLTSRVEADIAWIEWILVFSEESSWISWINYFCNNLRIFIVESKVKYPFIQIKSRQRLFSDKSISLPVRRKFFMVLTGHSFSLLGQFGIVLGLGQNQWESVFGMKASRVWRIIFSSVIFDLERLKAWNSGILVGKAYKVKYKVVFQNVFKWGIIYCFQLFQS